MSTAEGEQCEEEADGERHLDNILQIAWQMNGEPDPLGKWHITAC